MAKRRRPIPIQRQLDFMAGIWCPVCRRLSDHPEDHAAHFLLDVRVDPVFMDLILQTCPDKQEPPAVSATEGSTNLDPASGDLGGCTGKCA